MHRQSKTGFTLAELLIALAILGVIATFTIPKVLQAQQDSTFKAIAKEDAAAMSTAYQNFAKDKGITVHTDFSDLVPYLNYIRKVTVGLMDNNSNGSLDCSTTWDCYLMANGSVVIVSPTFEFATADNLRAIYFYVDPDGKYSDTPTGPGKSVAFFIYYNGRVSSYANIAAGTTTSWGQTYPTGGEPAWDPPWFNWN